MIDELVGSRDWTVVVADYGIVDCSGGGEYN